jgi:chromosomal replication initiation ATPase DnaA
MDAEGHQEPLSAHSSTAASIGIYTDRNVTPLTVENFNTWLASTRVVAQEGKLWRIAVPRQFNKDWLEAKLNGRVEMIRQWTPENR